MCGADPIEPEDVLDLVTSLVDKSLVMFEHDGGGARYGLLETIREFAHEHLTKQRYGMLATIREFAQERLEQRDDVAATAGRHCDYFLGFAKTGRVPSCGGPEMAEWTRRLEAELDNLRAAIALALSGSVDAVLAVKFEVALMDFRILRGYASEGRKNLRAVLALPGVMEQSVARGHALYVGGALATSQGDFGEATRLLSECLALRRGLGDLRDIAATLSTLSVVHLRGGDAEQARECQQESLAIFRQLGDKRGEAIGLLHLGEICLQLADDGNAREHFEQCLVIAQNIKHQETESECERYLGELALAADDVQAAQVRFGRALKVGRNAENKKDEALALWCSGQDRYGERQFAIAGSRMAEALRAFEAFE